LQNSQDFFFRTVSVDTFYRQLAERIVETVGYQGKLTFDSSKPDGTMRKLTDPSKLHSLGWHHKIEIEEGVQRMYEWYLK